MVGPGQAYDEMITGDHIVSRHKTEIRTPDASEMLEWLRRAPLDHGHAAEVVDEDGKAVSHGGDASLSGLLAYAAWYTVHAHGVRP